MTKNIIFNSYLFPKPFKYAMSSEKFLKINIGHFFSSLIFLIINTIIFFLYITPASASVPLVPVK
jgi:hypothetical protein